MRNPIAWIINRKVDGELKHVAQAQVPAQNNGKTTALGFIVSAVMALQIDWAKLMHGDAGEIGKLVGAIATGLWGWYTNRGTVGVALTPAATEKLSSAAADQAVEKIGEKLQS